MSIGGLGSLVGVGLECGAAAALDLRLVGVLFLHLLQGLGSTLGFFCRLGLGTGLGFRLGSGSGFLALTILRLGFSLGLALALLARLARSLFPLLGLFPRLCCRLLGLETLLGLLLGFLLGTLLRLLAGSRLRLCTCRLE